jgi:DNA-binding transcriptional MerR regulator
LRYWEQQFPILEPLKRSGGRRYYRPEDVAMIETIDQLVNRDGYTLKGAQQAIEDGKKVDVVADPAPTPTTPQSVAAPVNADMAVPAEVIAQLKGIRARLAAALEA